MFITLMAIKPTYIVLDYQKLMLENGQLPNDYRDLNYQLS